MSGIFLFFLQRQKCSLALPPSAAGLQARRAGLGRGQPAGRGAAWGWLWAGSAVCGTAAGSAFSEINVPGSLLQACLHPSSAGDKKSHFRAQSHANPSEWTLGLPGWGAREVVWVPIAAIPVSWLPFWLLHCAPTPCGAGRFPRWSCQAVVCSGMAGWHAAWQGGVQVAVAVVIRALFIYVVICLWSKKRWCLGSNSTISNSGSGSKDG